MEKAIEESSRNGFTFQDSRNNSESFSESSQDNADTNQSPPKEKRERGSSLKDEAFLKLISVSDASNQTLDLGSREDITDTQKELLALPAPNQILILAHGQGYIVIRNVNDIMQVDYINPTRPLSSIDFFQKVMIQLGLSAFGEPPSEKMNPLRTAYGWLADSNRSREELAAATDSSEYITFPLGFNNRIWSRSLRLRGFPAMYERYEVKADKKKFLEFNDCESQNDIIKGVWFELGELDESRWRAEPSQEFRNISLAFFNGEEIFDDDRYESNDWRLGQTTKKQIHTLEVQLKLLTASDQNGSACSSLESDKIQTGWLESTSRVDIVITRSSVWGSVLKELQTALEDKGALACFLIDVILNNRLEIAMNPKENPGRKYHGMVISNFKDKFKAITDSLHKKEEVAVLDLVSSRLVEDTTDAFTTTTVSDEKFTRKRQPKKKSKSKSSRTTKDSSSNGEMVKENTVVDVSDDETTRKATGSVMLEEMPLNAFILDANTESYLEGDWNVVKKEKNSLRSIRDNVGRSTEDGPDYRNASAPGTDLWEQAASKSGKVVHKNSSSVAQITQKSVHKLNTQQGPPSIAKQVVQAGKDFKFTQEDYPAMPSKPVSPVPMCQLKSESAKSTTVPNTQFFNSSPKTKTEVIMAGTKSGIFDHISKNNPIDLVSQDTLVSGTEAHINPSELHLSTTSNTDSHSSVMEITQVERDMALIKSATSVDNGDSTKFSNRLTKPRADSQPLTGPVLSKESSIRSSKSETELFAIGAVEANTLGNGENGYDQAELSVDSVASAIIETSEANNLAHQPFETQPFETQPFETQPFETLDEAFEVKDKMLGCSGMNSILEAAISDYQARARENNTLDTGPCFGANQVDTEHHHEQYYDRQVSQQEIFHSESAHTPGNSNMSMRITNHNFSHQPNSQIIQELSANIDLHRHSQSVGNTSIPFDNTAFSFDYNIHQIPLFSNMPRNLEAPNYFGYLPSFNAGSRGCQTQRISRSGSCSYCRINITASSEKPLWLCSGCGLKTSIHYCSRECLLSHAFEHSTTCEQSYENETISMVPANLFKFEPRPITPLDNRKMLPYMFRQNLFSIYFRQSRVFPPLLAAWSRHSNLQVSNQDTLIESQKHTGDYCVFSKDGSGRPDFQADVIFTMSPRIKEHKHALNRALNASFCILNDHVLDFLFRLIHGAIYDCDYYEVAPEYNQHNAQAFQRRVFTEFRYQFEMEFGFDTHKQNAALAREFRFNEEWPRMSKLIGGLERDNPILLRWHTLYGALYGEN